MDEIAEESDRKRTEEKEGVWCLYRDKNTEGSTMPATPVEKARVQLDFSGEALSELEALRKRLNASSRAEVIRDALSVLRWAVYHVMEGDKIKVERKKDGELIEVEFPFLLTKQEG